MTRDEFLKQEFLALRKEILDSKSRAFWILVVGIVLIVSASYLAVAHPSTFANPAIPIVLLVLVLAFIVEQNGIIRAGRYLREQVEPNIQDTMGWERWLESNRSYREVDRFFFAGFIASFLGFFAIASSLSLLQLNDRPSTLLSKCAATAYGLGAVLVVFVLIRHWHSCTTTADEKK